jgi:hypothetical protein
MYKINRSSNDIEKLEECLFKDLGFREREHLQEWIAKNPEVLGDDLLIIQKEYDGFNDTNERLDLLALDKQGNLVIIENKLDDTGKDVTWQALKYTSYCSTLTTKQILNLFQDYLDKEAEGQSAEELVVEFMEFKGDELYLNSGDQKMIFVANHYRKEVTSTVLWLLDHGINIQCFRTVPFKRGEDVFLQIEQIIPLPETEEFMIDAKEKKKEDLEKGKGLSDRLKTQFEFWKQYKARMLQFDSISSLQSPRPQYWFDVPLGKSGINLSCTFNTDKNELGIRVYIGNKQVEEWLPYFESHKAAIEQEIGTSLLWNPNENTRDKIIVLNKQFPLDDKDQWTTAIEWLCDYTMKFKTTFSALIKNK